MRLSAIACESQSSRSAPALVEQVATSFRQVDEDLPAVVGVGAAGDEIVFLELADRVGHRLGPHVLGGGEPARRLRSGAVEATEDGQVRGGEHVVGAQPAHELAEDDAQLVREIVGRRHSSILAADNQKDCAVYL